MKTENPISTSIPMETGRRGCHRRWYPHCNPVCRLRLHRYSDPASRLRQLNRMEREWSMSVVVEYKCPNCAASLTFDSDLQEMHCEYCGLLFFTFFPVSKSCGNRKHRAQSRKNQNPSKRICRQKTDAGSEENNIYSFTCPSCGGRIFGDSVTAIYIQQQRS